MNEPPSTPIVPSAPAPEDAAMHRNLRLLPAWWLLRWSWLGEALWVIYLIDERGLTLGQVFAFEASFAAVNLVAQVPTGILADRYGRKPVLLGAELAWTAAFVAFGLSEGVLGLFLSYLLFGLGMSMLTGADDAFLFDTLKALGRGEEFARRVGRLNAGATVVAAGFTLLGGLLVRWTPLAWPFVLSGLVSLLAATMLLPLHEPPRTGERGSFVSIGRGAASRAWRSPAMRWVIAISALSQVTASVVFVTFQPVVVDAGAPLWSLGLFGGGVMFAGATGAWLAGPVATRLGLPRTLALLVPTAGLGLASAAAGVLWVFPLFVVPVLVAEAVHPLVTDYLARRAPDSERATVLSLDQLVAQVGGIIVPLTLGYSVDRFGTRPSLAVAGGALLVIGALCVWRWERSGDVEVRPALEETASRATPATMAE